MSTKTLSRCADAVELLRRRRLERARRRRRPSRAQSPPGRLPIVWVSSSRQAFLAPHWPAKRTGAGAHACAEPPAPRAAGRSPLPSLEPASLSRARHLRVLDAGFSYTAAAPRTTHRSGTLDRAVAPSPPLPSALASPRPLQLDLALRHARPRLADAPSTMDGVAKRFSLLLHGAGLICIYSCVAARSSSPPFSQNLSPSRSTAVRGRAQGHS